MQNEIAYDYARQTWIEGAPAVALLKSQLTETLAMLNGSRGEDFAAFNGGTKANLIASASAELARLNALSA